MDVRKDAVMQRLHKANLSAVKARVRTQIGAINTPGLNANAGQGAQGGNNR